MTMKQSWIQQEIYVHTDIKLWGGTPTKHSPRAMIGIWKKEIHLTPWE